MRHTRIFDKIVAIGNSIQNGQSIVIKYDNRKTHESNIREVIPIDFKDGHNILTFCGLRKEFRKFSIENIDWVETREKVLH